MPELHLGLHTNCYLALFETYSLDWDCFSRRTFIVNIGCTQIDIYRPFPWPYLLHDEKWCVWGELHSTSVFVARQKVVCVRRTTFDELVCGATNSGVYETDHIPRECLWRDEKWSVWSEPHSTSVFVARQEVVCVYEANHIPRACLWSDEKWCVWSEPHSTSVFVARQEMVCTKLTSFHERDFGGPTYLSGLTLDY